MAIRVVLAEDSYLAREGIVRVLETLRDVELVATCWTSTSSAMPLAKPVRTWS